MEMQILGWTPSHFYIEDLTEGGGYQRKRNALHRSEYKINTGWFLIYSLFFFFACDLTMLVHCVRFLGYSSST